MKRPFLATKTTMSSDRQSEAGTRLDGRWLIIAQVAWVVLVLLLLGLFIAILPVYYMLLQTVCSGANCVFGQLAPTSAQALHAFGFSIGTYAAFNLAMTIVLELLACTVAGVLVWRKSNDWLVLLVALLLVMIGIMNITYLLELGHSLWYVLGLLLSFLGFGLLFLVGFLLPDGRFVLRWPRWLLLGWVAWGMVLLFYPELPFWQVLNIVMWFGEMGCVAGALIYRYRHISSPIQRQQIKWVMFCGTISYVVAIGANLPAQILWLLGLHGSFYDFTLISINAFILLLTPLSFGIALLRYHLWDIDILINRTLVYGSLTALLALIYFGLVIGLQSLVHLFTGQVSQSPVVIVASTLAIAALFQPLRRRIQAIIDRRFYRRKYDAARIVEAFSATLRNEVDLTRLSEHLLNVVQETMQPAHVSLWLRQPPRRENQPPQADNPPL